MAVKDLLDFSSASPGHQLPDIEWQRRFIVDDRPIAAAFGRTLSDRLADLVDIAMAVYVADRLRPRRPDPRSDPFACGGPERCVYVCPYASPICGDLRPF